MGKVEVRNLEILLPLFVAIPQPLKDLTKQYKDV